MMTTKELTDKYQSVYDYMSHSNDPDKMKVFGSVMTDMMGWMINNKPEAANEWIERLCGIRWKNYLTAKEADLIVSSMKPRAPWSREQWLQAMEQRGYDIEKKDVYNRCALYTVMNMLMSDSAATLQKYVGGDKLFDVVYSLAVDKLEDEDGNFEVRAYFGLD
jgi:hypothetical protein